MLLKQYKSFLKEYDRVFLKVPQVIFPQKLFRAGQYVKNDLYLNAEMFKVQFYDPAVKILGKSLKGFIFEQEYQKKSERVAAKDLARALDGFFSAIPKDERYHVELRTEPYLRPPVMKILENHGVGQVLSH